MIPYLPSDQFSDAILFVQSSIHQSFYRSKALSSLISYLETPDQFLSALQIVEQNIEAQANKVDCLKVLSSRLCCEEFSLISQINVTESGHASTENDQPQANHSENSIPFEDELEQIRASESESERVEKLLNFIPRFSKLPEELVRSYWTLADELSPTHERVQIITALAPHLPHSYRIGVLQDEIQISQQIENKDQLSDLNRCFWIAIVQTIVAMASEVLKQPNPDTSEEITSSANLHSRNHEKYQSELFVALAPILPKQSVDQVLLRIQTFTDTGYQAHVLCALAPFLSHNERNRSSVANDVINSIPAGRSRIKVWSYFQDKQADALRQAEAVDPTLTSLKTEALVEVAAQLQALASSTIPHLEQQRISSAQRDALAAIRDLNDSRSYALTKS